MAAYTDDYKFLHPPVITIALLQAMNTNEVNNGTTKNNAYANGWPTTANFSKYVGDNGGSGIANYMSKTFGDVS